MSIPVNYFKDEELACRCGCDLLRLHRGFRDSLNALRADLGRPMVITSAVRCSAHNKAVGGHSRSLHVGDDPQHPGQLGCLAVDVAVPGGYYRGDLFAAAWKRGFSIGWGGKRGFVHLDLRTLIGLPMATFDY